MADTLIRFTVCFLIGVAASFCTTRSIVFFRKKYLIKKGERIAMTAAILDAVVKGSADMKKKVDELGYPSLQEEKAIVIKITPIGDSGKFACMVMGVDMKKPHVAKMLSESLRELAADVEKRFTGVSLKLVTTQGDE